MPRDQSIRNVLIIGAGPIVIGQAFCEFDYSGSQACRVLKEENCRIILINPNPATIMTDPSMADATYLEPLKWEWIEKIIEKEKPDALLPTMGGQTALNVAVELYSRGILKKNNIKLIGVSYETIVNCENRDTFRKILSAHKIDTPFSITANNLDEAVNSLSQFNFPVIIRSFFTLGGHGGGVANNREEFISICKSALMVSSAGITIEESVLGWKEFELEVMRDTAGNAIVVCSIENLDPMGIHTGDSITIAPAQTLTDKEYQQMRRTSFDVMKAVGITSGGCNVQFAVQPDTGRQVVIEINPRVSRSSALASKATGFPIAKVSTRLALGYHLSELSNNLTKINIPSSFEPTIDYVVTKMPKFNFEKFPTTSDQLGIQMRSVGECMAIGKSFQESFQKALVSLEMNASGLDGFFKQPVGEITLATELRFATPKRIHYVVEACRQQWSVEKIHEMTRIDPWFISQIAELVSDEEKIRKHAGKELARDDLYYLKRKGFTDRQLARLTNKSEKDITALRKQYNITPTYKRIDTCAAEFDTDTAFFYSTYSDECEVQESDKPKILIMGSGPNRIGQGIEFDYCCVHAALAVREMGYAAVMVNCNPSTVSTDHDISDKLYFEPLYAEHVRNVIEKEQVTGILTQFGGQTALNIAYDLENDNVPLLGTSLSIIKQTEDRQFFRTLLNDLQIKQPKNNTFTNLEQALSLAQEIGYPIVVRPSYVIGGNEIAVIHDEQSLTSYCQRIMPISHPILIEEFLQNASEFEVDAVSDGKSVLIGAIMEQIDKAGIHSGDSNCLLTTFSIADDKINEIKQTVESIALSLGIVGLFNVQLAIRDNALYVLEVNPRASRTVPFVSKVTGVPLVKIAIKCILGESLEKQNIKIENKNIFAIKAPVFPWIKLMPVLEAPGIQMKSTGEILAIGATLQTAINKAKLITGEVVPFVNEYEIYKLQSNFV